ncbi:glycosyltransferase family 2 protein [Arcobacter sp.]|uniref:glycosyltransferase family 2 protein n=1 Tax=unclassified Arcobacter TaxID=2593671 RepID=UPI003AFF9364
MNNMLYPTISIITVTYNAKKYLEKTIISVLSQEYEKIEYIIIDGASTDGTINIIRKYEKDITYWVSKPDKGIYDAMNKAINIATGEWINFMNAGDVFSSKSTIKNIFSNTYNEDILYSDSNIIDNSGTIIRTAKATNLEKLLKPEMPFIHQSVFVRRSLLEKFPFRTDYFLASDLDFFIKLYIKGYKFKYLPNIIISNFLVGGLHTNNMIKYIAEGTNSLINLHPDIKKYTKELGIVNAFEDLNNNYQKSNFPHNLSKLLSNVESILSKKNNVLIYGYGLFGKLLYSHYKNKVIGVIDNNLEKEQDVQTIIISDIPKYNYDWIIISLLGREEEVKQALLLEGVPSNKIITIL